MPVYEYKALDIKGKAVTGIIDTESVTAAKQKLRASKIYPTSIKEVTHAAEKKSSGGGINISLSFSKVKPGEIAMMTRQLATLINAGFPLVSAIATLVPQFKSPLFKKTLSRIKDSIEEGRSFAEALAQYPDIFTPIYINMVQAGETSGTLEIVLDRLADITEKQQAMANRVKSAMMYPMIMMIISGLLLVFLMTVVVPNIVSIFDDTGQALPTPTIMLIAMSDFMKTKWWLLLIIIVLMITGFKALQKTEKGRMMIDKFYLNAPLFGVLNMKMAVSRFSRTLGSLLANGVTMLTSMHIVTNIAGNVIIAKTIKEASSEVEKGQSLNLALAASKIFPHLAIQMIQVGEQSGELENMLDKIADVYENEVELTLNSLTSIMEPLILVAMAFFVGFIVISILLPLLDMNKLVG